MIAYVISIISELVMAFGILYFLPVLGNLQHKIKSGRLAVSLICVLIISLTFNLMIDTHDVIIKFILLALYYSKYVIAFVILYKKITMKMICLALIIHSICAVCMAGLSMIALIEQSQITYKSEMILLLIRIIIVLILIIFKRKSEENYLGNLFKVIPTHTYMLVLINIFLADGLIETSNYKTVNIAEKEILIKVLVIILTIFVLVTLVSLLISVVSKKYYGDVNTILQSQIQAQINYYQEREQTYAEIRRFKHDYINHINCIQSLLNSERYAETSEYLHNISDIFPASNFMYDTGNFISDAILSDKQNSVKSENITINFDGTIPTSINETDLCIILGNAIDNAIEASRLMPDDEKIISVYGGFSHSYFILTVTNPTGNSENRGDILPFTSKANKSEHGFGLLNIKSVVDKYNGYMKIENKDNIFTLSLTFNSITTECVKT